MSVYKISITYASQTLSASSIYDSTSPVVRFTRCLSADCSKRRRTSAMCLRFPRQTPSSPLSPQWKVWKVSTSNPCSHLSRTKVALKGGRNIHHYYGIQHECHIHKGEDVLHGQQTGSSLLLPIPGAPQLEPRSLRSNPSQGTGQVFPEMKRAVVSEYTKYQRSLRTIVSHSLVLIVVLAVPEEPVGRLACRPKVPCAAHYASC